MKYQIVHQNHEIEKKIDAIKGVRTISGLPLKEAKALVDKIYMTTKRASFEGHSSDAPEVRDGIRILSEVGFVVMELNAVTPIRVHLEEAAKAAMNLGRYDIARDVIDVIITIGG